MEVFEYIFSFNERLLDLISFLGPLSYLVLFTIVFAVTGIILTPFLPGNSLLFISGTLAGGGYLNITLLYLTILSAAILGNILNYWVGFYFGERLFRDNKSKLFNKKYLTKAEDFYKKHGGKAILLARFFIIIRTYAPFVAGLVKMPFRTFLFYNICGAFIWVTAIVFGGYLFGGIPIIRDNFEYAAVGIVLTMYCYILYTKFKEKK